MGILGFLGGSKKTLEEYLVLRDPAFLRKCVECDIIYRSNFPFENNAEKGYFWGFIYPRFMWDIRMSLNDKKEYEPIPKKYERQLDFREILKGAADRGDGRAAFYVGMLYDLGIMDSSLYLENIAGALSTKDHTIESLHTLAKREESKKYHIMAAELRCEFEKAYRFLKKYTATELGAEGAEQLHILVDMMTVPHLPKIEDGIMNAVQTKDNYIEFKLFGRFLCGILAGFRAPLPLATMAVQKDIYVASGITKGPDIFLGANDRVEFSRKNLVKACALEYVKNLADSGDSEAKLARDLYNIKEVYKPVKPTPTADLLTGMAGGLLGGLSGGSSGSSDYNTRLKPYLHKPGDLPGTIYKNGVTYNKVSGCSSFAIYDSADRSRSLTIHAVISMSGSSAETDVGHITF